MSSIKKCIGCEKEFTGPSSICEDCFTAIEKTRSQFTDFPKRYRKGPLLILRTIVCFVAISSLAFIIALTVFVLFYSVLTRLNSNILIAFWIVVPFLLPLFVGVYLAGCFERLYVKKWLKTWSEEAWYKEPPRSGRLRNYMMPEGLLLFAPMFVFIISGFLLDKFIRNGTSSSEPKIFFMATGITIALSTVFRTYLAAIGYYFYKYTGWVKNLSR